MIKLDWLIWGLNGFRNSSWLVSLPPTCAVSSCFIFFPSTISVLFLSFWVSWKIKTSFLFSSSSSSSSASSSSSSSSSNPFRLRRAISEWEGRGQENEGDEERKQEEEELAESFCWQRIVRTTCSKKKKKKIQERKKTAPRRITE